MTGVTETSEVIGEPRRAWWRVGGLVAPAVLVVALVVGLKLRPVAAAKAAAVDTPVFDGKALTFSDRFATQAGLKVQPAGRGRLTPAIRVVGDVTFHPAYMAAVGTRARGFVKRVFKVEGDQVKEGEALAEIQSAELGQAQAEGLVAQSRKKAAERNAQREGELLGRKLTTARESEEAQVELEAQRAALAAARQRIAVLGGVGSGGGMGSIVLRAPLRGVVVERHLDVGQSVDGETVAIRVADLDHLWIELALFERSLGAVRKGDQVEVTTLDGRTHLSGRVAHVGEVIDPTTRSAEVRVEVDNTARVLRPGQAVQAVISATGPSRESVLVEDRAVTYVDGKATVFVEEAPRRVVPVVVKLGETDGQRREILEGLAEGQQVVVDGAFALKSELFR